MTDEYIEAVAGHRRHGMSAWLCQAVWKARGMAFASDTAPLK